MGVTNLELLLDTPTGAYYPGTNLMGKLMFTLDRPQEIRAIVIEVVGVARTSWAQTERVQKVQNSNEYRQLSDEDNTSSTELVNYTGSEEYFSNKYSLAGGPTSVSQISPAGHHEYPFSSMLPPKLPASSEVRFGNIRYTVRATINLPGKVDQVVEKRFSVLTPIDLNAKDKKPVKLEEEKTFCCLCCKSGPLTMVIALPKTGFIPGEKIPVTVEVDNASNVRVDNVVIQLEKMLRYMASKPKHQDKITKDTLEKVTLEAVECKGSKTYSQQITVPKTPIYNIDQCSIIKRSYTLKVIAEVSGAHCNLKGEIPILLGTGPTNQAPVSGNVASPTNQGPGSANVASPTFHAPGSQNVASPTFHAPGSQNVASPTFHVPGSQNVAFPTFHTPGSQNVAFPTYQAPGSGNMGLPTYQAPGSGYGLPTYQAPGSGNMGLPTYQAPGSGNMGLPTYQAPGSQNAAFPTYQAPGSQNAAFPTYQAPGSQNVAFPTYQAPGSQNAAFQTYQAPGSQNAAFPTYQAPGSQNVSSPTYQAPATGIPATSASTASAPIGFNINPPFF